MKDTFGISPEELKAAKEAEDKAIRERRLVISDLRKLLSTPEGRRFTWAELSRAKVFAPSFSLNQAQTNYNEGQRSVGIALLEDIMEAKPEAFYQMFVEAKSKEKEAKNKEKKDVS